MRTPLTPPPETQQSQANEEEVAAAIAAVLAGALPLPAGITPLAAVSALLGVLPSSAAPEPSVRDAAARLVVDDAEPLPSATGALRRAHIDNLIYRAHYAINAMKRLGTSVGEGEDLRSALQKERPNFEAHREANRRRVAASKMIAGAVELHGPILGWRHGHPEEPRASHLAADGWNFRIDRVPLTTGALPGVLPGCTCTVTAPYPDAPTLT